MLFNFFPLQSQQNAWQKLRSWCTARHSVLLFSCTSLICCSHLFLDISRQQTLLCDLLCRAPQLHPHTTKSMREKGYFHHVNTRSTHSVSKHALQGHDVYLFPCKTPQNFLQESQMILRMATLGHSRSPSHPGPCLHHQTQQTPGQECNDSSNISVGLPLSNTFQLCCVCLFIYLLVKFYFIALIGFLYHELVPTPPELKP